MQIRLDERLTEAASVGGTECESEPERVGRPPGARRDLPALVFSYALLVGVLGWTLIGVIAVSRADPRDLSKVLRALPGIPLGGSRSS
jgi:hypothetical protein